MRRKKTIPLIQNFWNKHLSGTHCCWLLFRWCICRADHQSNSRFQLLLCCSKCCFYKNNADKQMVKKYNTTSLMWWHNWETQGMKMWFLWVPKLVTTTATNEQVWAKKHGQHRQQERNIHILLQDAEDKGQEVVYLEKQQRGEFSWRFRPGRKSWASQARHLLLSPPSSGLSLRAPALSKQGETHFGAPKRKHWWRVTCRELFCKTVVESWDKEVNPAIKA